MTGRQALITVVAAIGYGMVGYALYRQRVVSQSPIWDSDLVVFALPAAIAFSALSWALWPARSPGQSISARTKLKSVGLAGAVTAVSAWVYLSVAFTRLGT